MKNLLIALLPLILSHCAHHDSRGPMPPGAGDQRPVARLRSNDATTLRLSQAQLDEFDDKGIFTPTAEQTEQLRREAGVAPSFLDIDYDEPDGERAELGYNIAVRTGRYTVSVLHRFLFTDEELESKQAHNRWMTGWPKAHKKADKEYDFQSYLIDSDGKYWMWVSPTTVRENLARRDRRKKYVNVRTPTALSNEDSFASEDRLRQFRKESAKLGIEPDHIYGR